MKNSIFVACAVLIGLSACVPDAEVTTDPATVTQGTVVDALVGKRLVTETATFIIQPNGTMGGTIRGETVVGTYTADSTQTCSTYSAPEFLTGRDWCSVPVISGNTVIFNRTDGTQSPVYEIQG